MELLIGYAPIASTTINRELAKGQLFTIKNKAKGEIAIETKIFTIFNQKLAGYLMQKGFVLIDLRPDINKTGRNVFIFNNTPELKVAIDKYMSR